MAATWLVCFVAVLIFTLGGELERFVRILLHSSTWYCLLDFTVVIVVVYIPNCLSMAFLDFLLSSVTVLSLTLPSNVAA